jgi:RNA polymerase sigma-54 factor
VALQMRQNLNLRMEQKLKLTPQMIQSIEILLLPQMALEERIMNEIESNPVLEIEDGPEEAAEGASDGGDDPFGEAEAAAAASEGPSATERFEANRFDDDPDLWGDLLKRRREARSLDEDAPDKMEAIASAAGPPPTLADHLLDQLRFQDVPERVAELLADLCWAIDRRGYLSVPLVDIVGDERLEDGEEAWECIRSCDPAGIGARDLADCLLLQLRREPGDNEFECQLISEHLDDVLRNRLPVVAQAMGVDVDRVQEAVEAIATLDPQPGLPFARTDNQFVVPDVTVERDENDEWIVSIPDSQLPKVKIDDAYYQLYDDPASDPREKAYLKEKLGAARFLLDAVAQRKRTLLKIATEIVKHQQAFLDQGPEHLRPLMRQNIADKIGMHVATVSRAVKDKYIQTPAGVLPLANFFSGGIATQDGSEAESSRSVKLKIKAMVEKEDPRKPLSDQAIADLLAKDGLDISRRTVTKYRIAMSIPSTRQRRRFAD